MKSYGSIAAVALSSNNQAPDKSPKEYPANNLLKKVAVQIPAFREA